MTWGVILIWHSPLINPNDVVYSHMKQEETVRVYDVAENLRAG